MTYFTKNRHECAAKIVQFLQSLLSKFIDTTAARTLRTQSSLLGKRLSGQKLPKLQGDGGGHPRQGACLPAIALVEVAPHLPSREPRQRSLKKKQQPVQAVFGIAAKCLQNTQLGMAPFRWFYPGGKPHRAPLDFLLLFLFSRCQHRPRKPSSKVASP